MPTAQKVSDRGHQPASSAVTPPARQPVHRPAVSAGERNPISSADSGAGVSAGSAPLTVTETNVSVLVVAPVLTVCRYLADIANIARGMPGVRSVHAGAAQTLTICYGSAADRIVRLAPGRFRIDQQQQQIEWEIRASALYSGTLSIHGDCTISQLESTLSSDQPSLSGTARDIHRQMLHRIARAVEAGLDRLRAPLADDDPAAPLPAAPQPSVAPHPQQLSSDSETVLGSRGLVREYWGGDVPDRRS